jgi:hypothetical protein
VDGVITLVALVRVVGALPPAAVCRIGRDVARALVDVHAGARVASPTAAKILLDADGAHLVLDDKADGTAARDIYALGAALAEAALGHSFAASSIRTVGGALPDRLVDAIEVLVAPEAQRLRNAAAAERMLAELEKLYGDGQDAIRKCLEKAARARDTGPPTIVDAVGPKTQELPIGAVLTREDLARLAVAGAQPAPTQPMQASPKTKPMMAAAPFTLPRDTDRIEIEPTVPRAVWIGVGVAFVLALVVLAYFAGMHAK